MNMENPKEVAYDAEIAPLMTQIIAVCKREKINLVATFELDPLPDTEEEEDRGPMMCTTVVLEADVAQRLKDAAHVLYDGWVAQPPFMAFTITTRKEE